MSVVNGYCTENELKAVLDVTGSTDDAYIDLAINSASRWVDAYCRRKFWLDGSAVARTFVARSFYLVEFCDAGMYAEVGDTTGMTVQTDAAGDGTFEQTWAASDYQLLPYNAAQAMPEARPYDSLRAVGSLSFPYGHWSSTQRDDRVKVTAKWGWPAVPEAVHQATITQAARIYKRRFTPEGVQGFGEFGTVRIQQKLDPDVCSLLVGYRRRPVLVR